jgi:DNA polymerase-4
VLRHPELADRPLIVGGRGEPTERAVVSTASYEAREFGVGSGIAFIEAHVEPMD